MIEELIVNTLFFDDHNRNWTSHYETLSALGVLVNGRYAEEENDCEGDDDDEYDDDQAEGSFLDVKKDVVFFTELLRNVARSLQCDFHQRRDQPSPLSDFLESSGLLLSPPSLAATEEICHFLLQHIHPSTMPNPASKIVDSIPAPSSHFASTA